MLVLLETPTGYALFKLRHESRLRSAKEEEIAAAFEESESVDRINKLLKLKAFQKFKDLSEALSAATALTEGKLAKSLKKFLRRHVEQNDAIAVCEPKLAGIVKEKLDLQCVYDPMVMEIARGLRARYTDLLREELETENSHSMVLGLAHSLSRYKLKFSPDKIDTMIVQAISLLDDLDKEINTYAMRLREWFGWHFPELSKIVSDNVTYAKLVSQMGTRRGISRIDWELFGDSGIQEAVETAARVSMGTEISDEDERNIRELAQQVENLSEYRAELFAYLCNRMQAIAPNLTAMVGEIVGARLIAHAGSLMNLAKFPASTIQILGAEKALFRALKTKHPTPKYGLIYHASLVGQATPRIKGKISRVLAAKTALAVRLDALTERGSESDTISVAGEVAQSRLSLGLENRAKVERRLRQLESAPASRPSGRRTGPSGFTAHADMTRSMPSRYQPPVEKRSYPRC
ncbi:snoRNP complex protein nop56 [Cyanidiococcus yangmingshanensis]|uniref:Nucleolar protein 58 n=1 Tax=Cyanidiococcus yangmingshanensis TaxID=2690220 RepID=A0A7J7IMZ5_9RHOD|nr:snoRNP complex protein nop56 [Cyanidiococcus yangmingshanensis]